jgi:hypothetical protein
MILLMLLLVLSMPQETKQEKPRVSKDSIELTVIGCLKGRVLKTLDQRQKDVESSPYVGERTFRLAGKKDVMKAVSEHDRHLVEVVGLVRRADLDDKGVTVGGVTISGGPPVAGHRPNPAGDTPVMDVESVRLRASSCTGGQ